MGEKVPLLSDLLVISQYFDGVNEAMYEDDLVARYGREAIFGAIRNGWLIHGRIPCGAGRRRCVVRLSESGRRAAAA